MTPQERELLTSLFDRLKEVERNPKDGEADEFIGRAVAAQPSAPYFMAQLLLLQDQAMSAAQARIRQLEQEAARAQVAPPARSFLGDAPAMGPWGVHRPAPPQPSAPAPASVSPAFAQAAQGGGFLRGALQTAAGVAGGALLFEGINSLLHHGVGGWGTGGFLPTGGAPTLIEETVINESGGASQPPVETTSSDDPGLSTQADDSFLTPASDDDGDSTDNQDDSDLV